VIRDKATDLHNDHEIYHTYLKTVLANPGLDKGNEFFLLVERMYVSHMLVSLRTFDDTDLRSHSLCNLVEEMQDHPQEITRKWFVRGYGRSLRSFGERDFSKYWGRGPCLSGRRLERDRLEVKRSCAKVRHVVNKWIAHNARRRRPTTLSHAEIDTALETVYEIMKRYYLLLRRADWLGSPLSPWIHIFDVPWNPQGNSRTA
jgi:hypothetical protein